MCKAGWRIYWQRYNGSLPKAEALRRKAKAAKFKADRKRWKITECEVRKEQRKLARNYRVLQSALQEEKNVRPVHQAVGVGGVDIVPEEGSPAVPGRVEQDQAGEA